MMWLTCAALPGPDPFAWRSAGQLISVPDAEPGPAREPEFFQSVMAGEAGTAARKAPQRPWWLPPGQVSHYDRMAGIYFVLAVAALIASFFAGVIVLRMFAGLWLLLSAWHLLSAVLLRRRARRG